MWNVYDRNEKRMLEKNYTSAFLRISNRDLTFRVGQSGTED